MKLLREKDPSLEQRMADQRELFRQYKNAMRSDVDQVLVIPVVVHVVYNDVSQRISEAQVQSQIDVLNEDFGRRNADSVNTPLIFRSRAANTGIRFCLAKTDPDGNITTGINYVQTSTTAFSNNDDIKQDIAGGSDAWDVSKYFNIWVGNLSGSLLGYAEFPSTPLPSTYGVVINYKAFGRIGTASPPYNLGRTATHEIGHCFYMFHIWGDEPGCQADDDINDTPLQKDHNFGCPPFPQGPSRPGGSCDSSDVSSMYMNFMDYTDDDCMNMWTKQQSTEMNAAIGFFAPGLLTSDVCQGSLSVTEQKHQNWITLSPNPSEGNTVLSFSKPTTSRVNIKVFNTLGKLVYFGNKETKGGSVNLDLTNIPPGLYFLSASAGEESQSIRLTIFR